LRQQSFGSFFPSCAKKQPTVIPLEVHGIHFASLWEIFDTRSLQHGTSLGVTPADSE
jgi:hypothetical protein